MGIFDGFKVASMIMDINTFKDEVVFPNISRINNHENKKVELSVKTSDYFATACGIAESKDIKQQIKEAKSAYNKAVLLINEDEVKSTALFLVSMQVILMCYYAKYPPLRSNISPIMLEIEEEVLHNLSANGSENLLYYYLALLDI